MQIESNGDVADSVTLESQYSKIEIVWPGKDLKTVPRQNVDGAWSLEKYVNQKYLCPLERISEHGEQISETESLLIAGDRLAALDTLKLHHPRSVTFTYVDVPRIEIDDINTAFHGDTTFVYSTWLSVLRSHVSAILPLMNRAGVIALHTGALEDPYARLLISEILGRENYIGTIVWQRSYAPRNMRGMKEFTATHDCITLFAVDKSALPAVGLRRTFEVAGFSNPDSDPRLAWRATHKGARTRREKSDFDAFVPPYRWTIVGGSLPEGFWRLNPLTGVIWGVPVKAGKCELVVQVSDSAGNLETRKFTIETVEQGVPPEPHSIPWLYKEIRTSGSLRIETERLPSGVVGEEYYGLCIAAGGAPFTAAPKRPGSGRYWEFSDDTLQMAYARDSVDLGADGNVIPRIKTYAKDLSGGSILNQQTWWPAKGKDGETFAGFTQDATKHLKKLLELGLIREAVTTAKPEHLLAQLIAIFAPNKELVLELFASSGDLAAVGLKRGNSVISLFGPSKRSEDLLMNCALPRLRAVVDGLDQQLESKSGTVKVPADAYVPFQGGGRCVHLRMGEWIFEQKSDDEIPRINRSRQWPDLATSILTSQGFMPTLADEGRGKSIDSRRAIVVRPEVTLTPDIASQILAEGYNTGLTVFYFTASEDLRIEQAPEGVIYRRVPVEIVMP